jgi:hypothetical protein
MKLVQSLDEALWPRRRRRTATETPSSALTGREYSPATSRVTVAPHLVRDHAVSMTVVSISSADPPAVSSVVTVALLLLVSLTRGTRSSVARGREAERGPRA